MAVNAGEVFVNVHAKPSDVEACLLLEALGAAKARGHMEGVESCAAGAWRRDVENAPEENDFLVALNSGDCGYIAYREEGYHGVFVVWCYGEKSYVPQSHILAFAELRPYQNTEQEDE